MTCSVSDCGRKAYAKALCFAHYQRVRDTGSVGILPVRGARGHKIPWLEAMVGHEGKECVEWPYRYAPNGYGQVDVNGVNMGAHRHMCFLAHGAAPEGKPQVAHSCGNKRCFNPTHLRWATPAENASDKYFHGTHIFGEDSPRAKLTDAAVREIRAADISAGKLAKKYGVSRGAILCAKRHLTWAHVA